MARKTNKTSPGTKKPTWRTLKRRLSELQQEELIALIQDLYRANKDNQVFLHARFTLGVDVLAPYKTTIHRWVCPDVTRNQDYSVSRAKKAISDYKKAIDRPEGIAELSVFYCESCAELLGFCGIEDEGYFNGLIRVFEWALQAIKKLNAGQQEAFLARLEALRSRAEDWGWAEDMDELLMEYEFVESDW